MIDKPADSMQGAGPTADQDGSRLARANGHRSAGSLGDDPLASADASTVNGASPTASTLSDTDASTGNGASPTASTLVGADASTVAGPQVGTADATRTVNVTHSGSRNRARADVRAAKPDGSPRRPAAVEPTGRRHWFLTQLRAAAPAMLGYAALRAFGMIVLVIWTLRRGESVPHLFHRFDAQWYINIAVGGYDHANTILPNGELKTSNLAFFPLFPGMLRGVATVLPVTYVGAGLIIDWTASLVAAWGLFAVGRLLYSRRVGIVLALLWAVLPYAIDESINLTESLFTALAAWCLYAVLTRRWLTAGVIALIAGLSRPTAVALFAAVGVAALIALWRREGPWWRPVVATAISPLGWLAYLVWVAHRLHRADGWFYVESQIWHSSFDGGHYSAGMVVDTLTKKQETIEPYVVTLLLAIFVVLLVLSVMQRQPWPLLTYSAVLFVTTVGGANFYHTDPRHLLPAFPVLLPLAVGVARLRIRNSVALIGLLAVISAWYGGYLALLWGFSF
ncbi:MAG TPA: hypothetical protein VFR11_23630 [Micromonosporaceae bacterium]|nr:hypothetical protein [Micromonosporaceae bacterium]